MKTLRIAALTTMFAAFGLMTGCDLFGTSSSNETPTLTGTTLDNTSLTAGGGATSMRGIISDDATGLKLTIKVNSSTGTDASSNFTITFKDVPSTETSWSIGDPAKGNGSIAAKSTAASGSYSLVYTVTDAGGATVSATVAFTVGGGSTGTATTEKTGNVYNVNGPNKGAYDLISDAGVSASSANTTKDLKDITAAGVTFDGALSSGNGATFVKAASSFDYANATVESITAAFAAGTALTSIPAPSVGDVYLVKTARGTTTSYIALKFTVVHAESTSSSANDGYVTFTYRK